MNVYEIREEYARVSDLLETIEEMKASGEEGLEQFEAETLDYYAGLQLSLSEKMDSIGKVLCNLESEMAAKKAEAKRLNDSAKSIQIRIDYIKEQMIKPAIMATKTKKIAGEIFTMSLRRSEAVQINNQEIVPADYVKEKITVSVDKVAIKKAIKNGDKIPGAELVENQSVQIK